MKSMLTVFVLLFAVTSIQAERLYDPTVGRWLNMDPAGVAGGINTYNSVSNNMVNGFTGGINYSDGMELRAGDLRLNTGLDAWGLWYFTKEYNDANPGRYDDYRCHYSQYYRTGVGIVVEPGDTGDSILLELGLRRPARSLQAQAQHYFPGEVDGNGRFLLLSDNLADVILPNTDRLPMLPAERTLSTEGSRFIAHFEGIRLNRYIDAAGHPTIGVGHLIVQGEDYTTITEAEALRLFQTDSVRLAQTPIRNSIPGVPLNQYQFDALTSWMYNFGQTNFDRSTLKTLLENRDYAGAANQFPRWNRAGGRVLRGLTRRRNSERSLFNTGSYSTTGN